MPCYLDALMKRTGITADEIAAAAGTPVVNIIHAQRYGKRLGPDLEQKIAQFIGFPVDVIWPADKPQAERTALLLHIG